MLFSATLLQSTSLDSDWPGHAAHGHSLRTQHQGKCFLTISNETKDLTEHPLLLCLFFFFYLSLTLALHSYMLRRLLRSTVRWSMVYYTEISYMTHEVK